MILRKHQAEVASTVEAIASGADISIIYVSVTPGGGKSALPGIIANRLMGSMIDRILWVVPRNALRDQGESDFPAWSRHRIRAAGNEADPCRGTAGYVTTYQAIVADPARHLATVSDGHRWAILLDEFHHVLDGGEWYRAMDPIIRMATLFVPMSGTLARGDGQPIAWLPYRNGRPDPGSAAGCALVEYSRSDALREGAIAPVHFRHLDGRAEWDDEEGARQSADSLASGDYASAALFTALRTEYAFELLDECLADWRNHRAEVYPSAKLLVVAPTIPLAETYRDHLHRRHIDALIATSDDSTAAREAIARFKGLASPATDALVTVAMAYEGMSVPPITHIACLTHIRSIPWLEQCFARANRTAPGKVAGYVYGPADTRFLDAIKAIEAEQMQALEERRQMGDDEGGEGQGGGMPGIRPIGSAAYRSANDAENIPGIFCKNDTNYSQPDGGMTPRAAETLLRKQIARHIEVFLAGKRPGSKAAYQRLIHAALKAEVKGKHRADCTVDELSAQWAYLKQRCPV